MEVRKPAKKISTESLCAQKPARKIKLFFVVVIVVVLCTISATKVMADWDFIYEDFEQNFINNDTLNFREWQYENKKFMSIKYDENHNIDVDSGGIGYLQVDFDSAGNNYSVIKQTDIHSARLSKLQTEFQMNYTGIGNNNSTSIVALRNRSGTGIGFIRLINLNNSNYELRLRSNNTNSPECLTLSKNTWYKIVFCYDSSTDKKLQLIVQGVGSISYKASDSYIYQIQHGKISATPISGKLQLDNVSIKIPEISDLWVSSTGVDTDDGTSPNKPLRTIAKGAKLAGPGTTIHLVGNYYLDDISPVYDSLRPGYKRQVSFKYKGLNPNGKYITLKGDGIASSNTVLDGNGMTFGNKHWGGILELRSGYVKITNLSLLNSDGFGVKVEGSEYVTVDNIVIDSVIIQNTKMSGIYVTKSKNIQVTNNEIISACQFSEDTSVLPQECITVTHSHNFEIANNKVHNGVNGTNGGEGIAVKGNTYNGDIYDNEVYNLPGDVGIYVGNVSGGTPAHPELGVYNINVFNNKVHDVEAGIAVSSEMGGHTQDINIFNNVAYDNTSHGIVITKWNSGTTGTKYNINIFNNTIYHNALAQEHGLDVQCNNPDEIKNISISNNIIINNVYSQFHVDAAGLQNVSIYNNLIYGFKPAEGEINPDDTTVCKNCKSEDPMFVNENNYDFMLQRYSIAIDAGLPVYVDLNGELELLKFDHVYHKRQDTFDIGAYEYMKMHLPIDDLR